MLTTKENITDVVSAAEEEKALDDHMVRYHNKLMSARVLTSSKTKLLLHSIKSWLSKML